MWRIKGLLLVVAVLSLTSLTQAEVTRIEIMRREAFAGGQGFGGAGAYEKIVGRFHGQLDPAHPLNAGIVDLDKAPRNAAGCIEYSSDFLILKPVDLAKGDGTLLYDVNNRGRLLALTQFNSSPGSNDPSSAADAGNGFLMRHGITVTWSGWLPDLPPTPGLQRLTAPVANGRGTIEQTVWDEFVFDRAPESQAQLSFRAASTDAGKATLQIVDHSGAAPRIIPAGQWEFVNDRAIRLLPAGTSFQQGLIYQFVYRAVDPPVAGVGLAATRDWVAFLRRSGADASGTANPLAVGGKPAIQRALAHGTSQSGRYLRELLYRGFNEDEQHRIVFDGMNPHIATARTFLNFRFAEPNRFAYPGGYGFFFYPDVNFPFAYETQSDPLSGKSDGLLVRCSQSKTCPKIVHTVTSTEYWLSSNSLVTTDPLGQRDMAPPANVRIYLISGTQHTGGRGAVNPAGFCQLPPNPVNATPMLRTMLLALERWVRDDIAPPPSRYPRLDDKTLVPGDRVAFPKVASVNWPATAQARPVVDYGPDFDRGILSKVLPERLSKAYPTLVSQVDADGNEIAGVRLPDISVPTGTYSGWALRGKSLPAAGELCMLDGSSIPFAKTKAEREAAGDSRPSLQERYGTPQAYVTKVEQAARDLERQGYLLTEDVERITALSKTVTW